jgi:SAM-dependent methyltransferase
MFKAGNFSEYGHRIDVGGKYVVKQRQDLLSLLPVDRNYESIIEFGCADGANLLYFSDILKIQKPNVFGVDICASKESDYDGINFVHMSAEEYLTNSNKTFDLVLLSDVLEHIYNPWKVLTQLKSILKPNGFILISVPNLQNLKYISSVISGGFNYSQNGLFDETQIRFFSLSTLSTYLEELDFKIFRSSFRPDNSLKEIRNLSILECEKKGFIDLKFENFSIRVDDTNLDLYTGQQILICATHV